VLAGGGALISLTGALATLNLAGGPRRAARPDRAASPYDAGTCRPHPIREDHMSDQRPTEPLRAEHRDLLPHLLALDSAATDAARWDRDAAVAALADIVGFLRGHLVPHAAAEEAVLYPAIEDAMTAPGATATMRADHVEIVARIDRLADTASAIEQRWPDAELARDLAHQLVGLSAILQLHFRKEEDVLLPVLDANLDADGAAALFARMGEAAHR
jgi:iron-sulfur cluster repair protein YtfE (RIC family)